MLSLPSDFDDSEQDNDIDIQVDNSYRWEHKFLGFQTTWIKEFSDQSDTSSNMGKLFTNFLK